MTPPSIIASCMKRKILLIEDEPFLLTLLFVRLSHSGYEVFRASDGQKGLSETYKIFPDLIILDKEMPEMNGDEVARAVKQDSQLKHIPVIMISADVENLEMSARGCGVEYYLAKPFEAEALLAMIKSLLHPVESQQGH